MYKKPKEMRKLFSSCWKFPLPTTNHLTQIHGSRDFTRDTIINDRLMSFVKRSKTN